MMDRRAFIACCAVAVFPAPVTSAEPTKRPRVGFLGAESQTTNGHFLAAFRSGMRELGYAEGQNLVIEERRQSLLLSSLAIPLLWGWSRASHGRAGT